MLYQLSFPVIHVMYFNAGSWAGSQQLRSHFQYIWIISYKHIFLAFRSSKLPASLCSNLSSSSSEILRTCNSPYLLTFGNSFISLFSFTANKVHLLSVGCFQEPYYDQLFPIAYLDYRRYIWSKLPHASHVIRACALAAVKRGYTYFAIKNYGVCSWGSRGLTVTRKNRRVSRCFRGLGGPWLVSVYKIVGPRGECVVFKRIIHFQHLFYDFQSAPQITSLKISALVPSILCFNLLTLIVKSR